MRKHATLAVCTLLSVLLACDKATPVAPTGAILTITANPVQILPNGTSSITVVGRKEGGQPVNPGTDILLSTNLGSIEPVVKTDDRGVARATLRGEGAIGTATVTAISGAADTVSVDVQVGAFAASITLQATPTVVTEAGASIALLSLVRDENGQLLANAAVNFLTDLGILNSGGGAIFTDAGGAARDTLVVTPQDLEGVTADTFTVRAQTAAVGGLLIEATFDVAISRLAPVASFTAVDAGDCSVAFTNTTTGQEPLTFEWDFNGDGSVDRQDRNPIFDYLAEQGLAFFDSDGDGTSCPDDPGNGLTDDNKVFTVTLTATNGLGTDIAVSTVTVNPN